MNPGALAAQQAAPIMVKVLLEDDSVYRDNALISEITQAGNSLPQGSFFSISVCSHSLLSWKWVSSSQGRLPLEQCIEGSTLPEAEREALVDSIDSASAEINGIALRTFQGDPKSVQKWIIFVKNSQKETTIARTLYLSTMLSRCIKENCYLIRINSSNPHKITNLVEDTKISPEFCVRMESHPWSWLREKITGYVAEIKSRNAAEAARTAQTLQEAQNVQPAKTFEEELLAIAAGKEVSTL